MECTRAIMKAKGVGGLYAGFVPFLMQSSAKSSIRFFAFEALSNGVDTFKHTEIALQRRGYI
jgi:hypothetical protein